MRQLQICLGFPCNWHTLDKIMRHNRPRKVKNAFRGQISAKKAANCWDPDRQMAIQYLSRKSLNPLL